MQFLAVSSFTSNAPGAPSGTGWKLLLQSPNTYSCLTIYTRTLVSADVTSNISFTANDWSNAELRTYRCDGGEQFRVDGGGNGLVADSTTSYGWIIRCWASSQINTSGGSAKTLTPPAGLLNAPASTSFNWYDGGLFGDDPVTSGSTGTSTATQSATETTSPQWVNIALDTFQPDYDSVLAADTIAARYKLDETTGTTLTDYSVNARNGTYRNSPTLGQPSLLVANPEKKSVAFNGSNQWAQVNSTLADAIITNGGNTLSVEAWIRPNSLTTGYIVKTDEVRVYYQSTGSIGYTIGTTTGSSSANGTSSAIPAGSVAHVVITYDGTIARLFINAVPNTTLSKSGTFLSSTAPMTIGAFNGTDGGTPSSYFPGRIGEVTFYNSVLSPAKIAKRYASATIKSSQVLVPAASAVANAPSPLQAGPNVQIFPPAAHSSATPPPPSLSAGSTVTAPAATASGAAPDVRVGALYPVTKGELDFYSDVLVPDPSGTYEQPIDIAGLSGEGAFSFTGLGLTAGAYTPSGVTKMLWLRWTVGDTGGDVTFNSGNASIAVGPYSEGMAASSFSPTVTGEGSATITVTEGAQYLVQLGWRTGDPSDFTLTWTGGDVPYYDDFATPLEMDSDSALMTTTRATVQSGELVPIGATSSVWSRWQAPASEVTTVETSNASLSITVYDDGVDISTLVEVASGTGSVSFSATAGNFYMIQICEIP